MTILEGDIAHTWKSELESAWRNIPRGFRNDHSVRHTLRCHLFGVFNKAGYTVVADYMPPRIQDRAVDLIAMNSEGQILYAICLETLVSLAAVKSLSSFEASHRIIFTTGLLEKKVKESRFFLKPGIDHIHLDAPDRPS
jgi:hypothetical protein